MNFQILNIALYNKSGDLRTICFKPNATNIITGASKTGKSALIHIVNFCLTGKDDKIPYGVIRDKVEWFALKIQLTNSELFIARQNPALGNDIYHELNTSVNIPNASKLKNNIDKDELQSILDNSLEIKDYTFVPPIGQRRAPGPANINKSLVYCFQEQNIIANNEILFHRQAEPFLPQNIKDFMPYYFGVISDEYIKGIVKLKELRRRRLNLNLENEELQKSLIRNYRIAANLVTEAIEKQLLENSTYTINSWEDAHAILSKALKNPSLEQIYTEKSKTDELLASKEDLLNILEQNNQKIDFYRNLKLSQSNYAKGLQSQHDRLHSIELLKKGAPHTRCPLCDSEIQDKTPTIESIKKQLHEVDDAMKKSPDFVPELSSILQRAIEKGQDIKNELKNIDNSIRTFQITNAKTAELNTLAEEQALVKGRISMYLENTPKIGNSNSIDLDVLQNIDEEILLLEEQMGAGKIDDELQIILKEISEQIKNFAMTFQIEHCEKEFFFNSKKLTIEAKSGGTTIGLMNMGSGENWVCLHIAVHLAFHNWFSKNNCSVPRFLFIDQPSQVYFPNETKNKKEILKEKEKDSLKKLFSVIKNEATNYQVIITEHVDLNEKWYTDMICEKWWDDNTKLIPTEWL